jgi:maleamate amidohydrolase
MSDDLLDNYRRAYDNRIGFGERAALILIDFVQAYFEPDCELYGPMQPALDSALRLRQAAWTVGIPVIYTAVRYTADGRNGGRFFQKAKPLRHFVEGAPWSRFADGLVPAAGEEIIIKQYPSAFFGTSLASTLTTAGIDTLILTGLTTSGCVRASCVDCCSHGFIPIVVAEACGDRHAAPHEANLFDMNAKYADVVGEAEALSYLHRIGRSA